VGYKALILLLIISIIFPNCTTVDYSVQNNFESRNYDIFNYNASSHSSKIFLLNGKIIKTDFVSAKMDSLYYTEQTDTIAIATSIVEKVIVKNWVSAITFGLIVGTITLFGVGYSVTTLAGGGMGAGFLGVGSGFILGIGVLTYGILNEGETKYIFNDKAKYKQNEYYKDYHKRKAEQDSKKKESPNG
jgi:uncharacterized membrane protein